jgi:hypothetical protein
VASCAAAQLIDPTLAGTVSAGFKTYTIVGVPATVAQTGQPVFSATRVVLFASPPPRAAPTIASPPVQWLIASSTEIVKRGESCLPSFYFGE